MIPSAPLDQTQPATAYSDAGEGDRVADHASTYAYDRNGRLSVIHPADRAPLRFNDSRPTPPTSTIPHGHRRLSAAPGSSGNGYSATSIPKTARPGIYTYDASPRTFAPPRCTATDSLPVTARNARAFAPRHDYGATTISLWLSRDPIAERGGVNLYGMCYNNSVGLYDYLGRDPVVVAGGTSVNDPGKHDQSGWNFLNTAVRRAIALEADIKGKGRKEEVVLVIYAPPYERRATFEGKAMDYYLRIVRQKVSGKGIKVVEIRASAELTSQLVKMPNASITSLDYFGHSDSESWFLEYSSTPQTNGTHDAAGNRLAVRVPANTGDSWGPNDAKIVPKSRFALGATVSSYGCNQGEPGGFADVVNKIWGVATKGSIGRTDYTGAGAHGGPSFPTSDQGYQTYPAP